MTVFDEYEQRFGEPLAVPMDYGHGAVTFDELVQYGTEALEQGEPINWEQRLPAIPDGAKS